MTRTLIVLAKAPRLGAVKTRLARDIGSVAAWVWHRRQLATLLRRLGRGGRWRRVLALAPARAVVRQARGWEIVPQARGDLGRRMAAAFRHAGRGPAVLVGSDIPDLGPAHIDAAFRALGRHGAVVGPTDDGGYWLIGFKRPDRAARWFRGVRWSGPHALTDTLANADPRASTGQLGRLADIDTGVDLAAWRSQRGCLPRGARSRCRPRPRDRQHP